MTLNQNLRAIVCAFGLVAAGVANGQDDGAPPPAAPPAFSAAELEKLAAPIALHPDPLIALILPASVYPLEIVQAARFLKDNPGGKVADQPWDENVRALAEFPEMIQKMNDDLDWTMDLGRAFLEQQKELMDTIQALRNKASSSGVLKTSSEQVVVVTNTVVETTVEQQVVYVTNTVVQIQPSNPEVIYVPSYPPTIYAPPPAYVGPPPVLTFAAGVATGLIIANNCDWNGGGVYVGHHGDVDINVNNNVNVNRNTTRNTSVSGNSGQKWQPDQSRMASSGAPGARSSTQSAQARGYNSGASPGANSAKRASPASASTRPAPSTGAPRASQQPAAGASRNSPSAGTSASRPSPSASKPSAFSGSGSGSSARQSSSRGASSRGGGGGGGGGRRR